MHSLRSSKATQTPHNLPQRDALPISMIRKCYVDNLCHLTRILVISSSSSRHSARYICHLQRCTQRPRHKEQYNVWRDKSSCAHCRIGRTRKWFKGEVRTTVIH